MPLVWSSLGVIAALFILSGISYFAFSSRTASTFLERANAAEREGDFAGQVKWLERYSMLKPNDHERIVSLALAADSGADLAESAERYGAISEARKQLSNAIARLGKADAIDEDAIDDLRRRLIPRLLQMNGNWNFEAEHQVQVLDAPVDDPEANRWMALAISNLVFQSLYRERDSEKFERQTDYWNWLATQKLGTVLSAALRLNSTDLELIGRFVSAAGMDIQYFNFPELSGDSVGEDDESKLARSMRLLKDRVDEVTKPILSNQDSRSQLILYQVESQRKEIGKAKERMSAAADAALDRLAQHTDASDSAATESDSNKDSGDVQPISIGDRPSEYWDYYLVTRAAALFAQDEPDRALQWYERLMVFQSDEIPTDIAAGVFASAGRLVFQQGFQIDATEEQRTVARERAIEIFERGLDDVDPGNLNLLGMKARLLSEDDLKRELAEVALDDFKKAIEAQRAQLARTERHRITAAQRTAWSRQIDTAQWRFSGLRALTALRQGNVQEAIRLYRESLESTIDVEPRDRVEVAQRLAAIYGSQGLWDLAAESLQQAVDLEPGNSALRAEVAGAWTRAGHRLQAMEQWRMAGNAESNIALQVASAEALFNYQLRLLPHQRDFSVVRSHVARVQGVIEELRKSSGEALKTQIDQAARRLDILAVSLPDPNAGLTAEEHLRSTKMADAVEELSLKHDSDQAIQAFAAERLAEAGRDKESDEALARLTSIVGEDSAELTVIQARIEALRGDPASAAHRLLNKAESVTQAELNVDSGGDAAKRVAQDARNRTVDFLLTRAGDTALAADDPELAFKALTSIPKERRSPPVIFSLINLMNQVPNDSDAIPDELKGLSPQERLEELDQQLEDAEGESGTYKPYLTASRLIDEMLAQSDVVEKDDQRFGQAKTHVREILTLRPRWGNAISLEGMLSVIQASTEEKNTRQKSLQRAVQQLRRGIAAGDRRMQTRQLLMRQLMNLGDFAGAEEIIQLISFESDSEFDKYGVARIDLLQRQGDFDSALGAATEAAKQRPDDYLSHVVLARTATVAAEKAQETEKRTKLFDQAESAIETAESLVKKTDLEALATIFSTRIRLYLAQDDKKALKGELSRIEKSSLDEQARLSLRADVEIAQGDLEAAIVTLERVDAIETSQTTRLRLVRIYRELGRENEAIGVLQKMQRENPENEALRTELARSIAVRDGANVDWDELSKLLGGEDVSSKSQLLYATLLGTRGSENQKDQALGILRDLVRERSGRSNQAARVLVSFLIKFAGELPEEQSDKRDDWHTEIRTLYESLVDLANPPWTDLYGYASFLLSHGEFSESDDRSAKTPDLIRVENLLTQLQSIKEATFASLEVAVRLNQKLGKEAPEVVGAWADNNKQSGYLNDNDISTGAGSTLLKLGMIEEGIQWFEQAYQDDAKGMIGNYIVALNKVGRFEKSVEVCIGHFEKHSDVVSATLLVETLLNDISLANQGKVSEVIESALMNFSEEPALIEGVATLRMQEGQLDEAVTMYRKVLKLAPLRVRTLNNLSMALADLPGRAEEGLKPIDVALGIAKDNPELLDTKGVVLMAAKRWGEAEDVFRKAMLGANEPRYHFHLILALLGQSKAREARSEWDSLDLERLDPMGLTPKEQKRLTQFKQEYGS